MSNTASLKKEYVERIAPALKSQFQYSSAMQVPVLKKIVSIRVWVWLLLIRRLSKWQLMK